MLKKLFSFTRSKNKADASKTTPSPINVDSLDEHNPKQRQRLLERLRQTSDADELTKLGSRLQDNPQLIADFIASPHPMLARLAASRLSADELSNVEWQQLITLPHSLAFQQRLISQCDDAKLLQLLASSGHSSELRQQACSRINQPEQLRELLNSIGNRDKKVRQQLKEALAKQRQIELDAEQQQQQIEALSAQSQYAASHAWNPQLGGKLKLLKQQFDTLQANLSDRQRETIKAHLEQISEAVAQHQAELDAAHQAEQLKQQHRQLAVELAALLQRLQQSYHCEQADELAVILSSVTSTIKGQHEQLQPLLTSLSCLHQAHQNYQQQLPTLQTLQQQPSLNDEQHAQLQELLNNIAWPADAKAPPLIEELNEKLAPSQPKTQPAKQDTQRSKQLRSELKQHLIDCEQAVDNKDLKTVNQLSGTIRQQLTQEGLTDKELSAHWQRLNKRIYELRDWHKFASMPKRQQLCDEMSNVVNSKLSVQLRADKIKQLQADWKALGNDFSPESKQLWSTFKAAADIAYEPCKIYFAEQQQLREQNSLRRSELCQQLEQYLTEHDFEQSDFEQIDLILQQAKREWRQYSPAEKRHSKAQQQRFNTLLKSINNHRQQHIDLLIEQKQRLIDEAQQLVNSDELASAIEQAKQLQQRWQQGEKLPHAIDKKLWHELRAHLDILFERRQQQQQQRNSAQQENVEAGHRLIEQLQQLSQLDDQALSNSREDYQQLISQYQLVGERPHNDYKQQQIQFKKACDAYDSHYAGLSRRAKAEQWASFLTFCQQLNQRDLASEPQEKASLQNAINSAWAELDFPEPWRTTVIPRIDNADVASDEQQHRKLCIELELLLGVDSPSKDQALRMELQMNKLQKGLGQNSPSPLELRLDWLKLAACPSPELQQRFDQLQLKG
ncbi:uncharacterized protein DUF349 [Sinobacterium caligoides]|uniref:Uncharacterized protein DUF349 n=1 Tax=Sinobacterium caligoides TaxID=933926 RepID=A0A3N2D4Y1_9GAMM|nr:DUF349 domain-containing protein [Sinobacterium caligoides]ROR94865.1 uncharacterized protein DUF349 [Sinobacterium caligoides]